MDNRSGRFRPTKSAVAWVHPIQDANKVSTGWGAVSLPPINLGMSVAKVCPVFVVISTLVPSPLPSSLYDLAYWEEDDEYKEVWILGIIHGLEILETARQLERAIRDEVMVKCFMHSSIHRLPIWFLIEAWQEEVNENVGMTTNDE